MNLNNSPFRKYRDLHQEMESNAQIRALRDSIEIQRKRLEDLEKPYREQLSGLEDEIKTVAIEQGDTVEEFGVRCKYYERKSTSWKSVAVALNAPAPLINEHTKTSQITEVEFVG